MDDHEPELVSDNPDRRAFLRRMVAAGFALPVIASLDSMLTADAAGKDPDKCHDHPQGHGPGGGHGHEDCTTTTPAPTTTAAPTTTPAPSTTTVSAP